MFKKAKFVAAGHAIFETFNSRNNDMDGYWAIGKLCLYAKGLGSNFVSFDLLDDIVPSDSAEIAYLKGFYKTCFYERLKNYGIDAGCAQKFTFNLSFTYRHDGLHSSPYICNASLLSCDGREFSFTFEGLCRPHDPSREFKSLRSSRVKLEN